MNKVAGFIAFQFLVPKLHVGRRLTSPRAVMSVPEASVNEDNCSKARQYDVWRSGQVSAMKPIAVAACKQSPTDEEFRLGVLIADGSHHSRPVGRSYFVSHVQWGLSCAAGN